MYIPLFQIKAGKDILMMTSSEAASTHLKSTITQELEHTTGMGVKNVVTHYVTNALMAWGRIL